MHSRMKKKTFRPSELIILNNGTIYHLGVAPGQLASDIITVGDQHRVDLVKAHMDHIEIEVQKREFRSVTGRKGGKRFSVISTGIGPDNIDIAFNEVDALFNIDFKNRTIKEKITPINFIRIGTSGAIQAEIDVDQFIVSKFGIGLDNVPTFYKGFPGVNDHTINLRLDKFKESQLQGGPSIYGSASSLDCELANVTQGIAVTNPGFYGPQGRSLRLELAYNDLIHQISNFTFEGRKVTNMEMETATMYALANLFGHRAISFNAILANRITSEFSSHPKKTIHSLIELVLDWWLEK